MARFDINTLLFKRIICFQRTRMTAVRWYALCRKSAGDILLSHHISCQSMCLYATINYPPPFSKFLVGDIITAFELFYRSSIRFKLLLKWKCLFLHIIYIRNYYFLKYCYIDTNFRYIVLIHTKIFKRSQIIVSI